MDSRAWDRLVEKIAEIARTTPAELVMAVLPRLIAWDGAQPSLFAAGALANIPNPQVRADFSALFDVWQKECPQVSGSAVALALQSSLQLHKQHEQAQVDLTWTGPETQAIPLRRMDGALLQVIDSARENLLIVSFAVYRIQSFTDAIWKAIQRGVRVRIVLESPQESGGKVSFSAIPAFGADILRQAELYVWPLEQRQASDDNRRGSLHAKIALADQQTLFISSANLTEYAMTLNMEMGVLIQGGELPGQVRRHFDELISLGILRLF